MATVYFSNMKTEKNGSPLLKIKKLFARCKPDALFSQGEIIAIKAHFGEFGNTAFIPPVFCAPL